MAGECVVEPLADTEVQALPAQYGKLDKIAIINLSDEVVVVAANHTVAYASHGQVMDPDANDNDIDYNRDDQGVNDNGMDSDPDGKPTSPATHGSRVEELDYGESINTLDAEDDN